MAISDDVTMFYGAKPDIFEKATILRENMTEAEKLLWEKLKDRSLFKHKFRRQHPIVAGNANYTSARNHDLELLVGKLPSARHQRTTILMARQHRTVKRVDHLLERKIAQMGEVENHAQPLELGEQFAPAGGQRRLTGGSGNYNGNASSIRRTTSCGGTPTARPRQVWPRMVTTMAL